MSHAQKEFDKIWKITNAMSAEESLKMDAIINGGFEAVLSLYKGCNNRPIILPAIIFTKKD